MVAEFPPSAHANGQVRTETVDGFENRFSHVFSVGNDPREVRKCDKDAGFPVAGEDRGVAESCITSIVSARDNHYKAADARNSVGASMDRSAVGK